MTAFTVTRDVLAPALGAGRRDRAEPHADTDLGVRVAGSVGRGMFVTATDMDMVYRERIDEMPREPWRACVDAERFNAFVAGAQPTATSRCARMTKRACRCGRARVVPPSDTAGRRFPLFTRTNEGAVELTFDAAALAAGLRAVAPAMSTGKADIICAAPSCTRAGLSPPTVTDGAANQSPPNAAPAPDVIIPAPTVLRLLSLLRGIEGPLSVIVSVIADNRRQLGLDTDIEGDRRPHSRLPPRAAGAFAAPVTGPARGAAQRGRAGCQGQRTTTRSAACASSVSTASCWWQARTMPASAPAKSQCRSRASRGLSSPRRAQSALLLSALDVIDAEIVEIHTSGPQHSIWLCAADEPHNGAVIMSMRVRTCRDRPLKPGGRGLRDSRRPATGLAPRRTVQRPKHHRRAATAGRSRSARS